MQNKQAVKINAETFIQQQQLISQLLEEIQTLRSPVQEKRPDLTLHEAVSVYRQYAEIYQPKTLEPYLQKLPFVLSYFPKKTMRTLTPADIREFISIRKKEKVRKRATKRGKIKMIQTRKPVSNSTINRNLYLLSVLFKAAREMYPEKYGDIQNPVTKIKKLPERVSRKYTLSHYYSEDELKELGMFNSDSHRKPLAPLVIIMCKTMCRPGEALKLCWNDVDFMHRKITFRDTKTHQDRDVPMTHGLYEFLVDIRFRRNWHERVIVSSLGKPYSYYPRDSIINYIKSRVEYKGVHSIRRSVITAIRRRFGERISKPLAGHSVSSIHEVYTVAEWEELQNSIQILDFD